jgi:TRAP-type C4-dicarboxylate transport system permease small subunit
MNQALRRLKRAADIVGAVLFLLTFAGFLIQIFARYVLNHPLGWSEEYTMIVFIWTVFWAAAFMVPERNHVSFDVVYELAAPQGRRVLTIISMLCLVVAFVILLPAAFDYIAFMARKKSPVMLLPMSYVYGSYLLFVASFIVQGLWRLRGLFGRDWRKSI